MTIYKKLTDARVGLLNSGIKKTGTSTRTNKNTGYKTTIYHYQLEDFLPETQKQLQKNGLCGFCSFGELPTLTIVNSEKPEEKILFQVEKSEAVILGASKIQNLGGTITFLRRYLWMLAMEISESDPVDTENKEIDGDVDLKKYKESTKKPEGHFCGNCESEVSEREARESLEKYNTVLCKNCIKDKFETIANISNVLLKVGLNGMLADCEKYLKNNTAIKDGKPISLINLLKETKNFEGAVKAFLKNEISKIDTDFVKAFHEKSTLKDYADGLKALK